MGEMLPDIPRIFTAVAEWLACLLQIWFMRKRLKTYQIFLVAAAWLFVQSAFLTLTDHVPLSLWLFCMLFAIFLMFLFLAVCCRESAISLVCACVKAFLLAELAASFEWQMHCFLMMYVPDMHYEIPLFIGIYGLVFGADYILERRLNKSGSGRAKTAREMWWMLLIGGVSFLFSNISFTSVISPFSGQVIFDNFYIRTLVDLQGLVLLYAYQAHMNEIYVLNELTNLDNLYKSQYDNYRRFQESMDVINIKYHDLKHQIHMLRSEAGAKEWPQFLETIEREIEENHIFLNTGNSVLDMILSEKLLLCKKEEIDFTCMIDGQLLDFMQAADICSVFGNALDNAIENACRIKEKERRLINVTVKMNCGCVYILIRNYTEQEIELNEDGFPVESTKEDRKNHGYGLKSIRRTVEKYGGTCAVRVEEGWFVLRILFGR